MTDETVTYPIPGPHDRRCELSVDWLQTRAKVCHCARRRQVRDASVVMDNAAVIASETLARLVADQRIDMMALSIERMMRQMRDSLVEARRELIPTSLTITTEHDPIIDGTKIAIECLTLPGGEVHDMAVLEVATDWVARRYRLRS